VPKRSGAGEPRWRNLPAAPRTSTAKPARRIHQSRPLSHDIALALVGAILELVATRIEDGRTAQLPELTDSLTDFVACNPKGPIARESNSRAAALTSRSAIDPSLVRERPLRKDCRAPPFHAKEQRRAEPVLVARRAFSARWSPPRYARNSRTRQPGCLQDPC
jgi:hypothetical protein